MWNENRSGDWDHTTEHSDGSSCFALSSVQAADAQIRANQVLICLYQAPDLDRCPQLVLFQCEAAGSGEFEAGDQGGCDGGAAVHQPVRPGFANFWEGRQVSIPEQAGQQASNLPCSVSDALERL